MKVLLTSLNRNRFSELAAYLKLQYPVEVYWAESGAEALCLLGDRTVDLVITDESLADMTGLAFLEKLIRIHPMVNCAAVSSLSTEAFHEATEGLGILAQLTSDVNSRQATELMAQLARIQQRS